MILFGAVAHAHTRLYAQRNDLKRNREASCRQVGYRVIRVIHSRNRMILSCQIARSNSPREGRGPLGRSVGI
jgi:hypothetical protein